MNFVNRNIDTLLVESKSSSTRWKTERDVRYFEQYLREIKCVDLPMIKIPENELIDHMSVFFSGIKKKKDGSDYEPTSLWSMYASLKRHLKEQQYNFSNNQTAPAALSKVTDVLKAACRELKKSGLGNKPHKSDAVTANEIQNLFESGIAGLHNPLALNNAMLINMMFLGFRGAKECYQRQLGDIKLVTVDGTRYLTVVKERITKTRNGEVPKDASLGVPRLAELGTISCPVKAYECLLRERPDKFKGDETPLFLRPSTTDPYQRNIPSGKWFYNSRVGINHLTKMTQKMFGLSDVDTTGRHITNTSCRKSVATTMLTNNHTQKAIMRQMRHTNPNSVLNYDESTGEMTQAVTKNLFGNTKREVAGPSHNIPGAESVKIFNITF